MMDDSAKQAHDSVMTLAMCPGMTLRDWFAGQIIAGLVVPYTDGDGTASVAVDFAVEHAYAVADAMMKEREKCETASTDSETGGKTSDTDSSG